MATSHDKLEQLTERLINEEAEGPLAIAQMAAVSVLPHVRGMLPEDPDELDELLTAAGDFVHSLRSDPAPAQLGA